MADEKVMHGFDGRPLASFSELVADEPAPDPYPSQTQEPTRDGRWATQLGDGTWRAVDEAGTVLRDQVVSPDQVIL